MNGTGRRTSRQRQKGPRGIQEGKPVVGVLGGSKSDFPTLEKAGAILAQLEIPYELLVVSAHRTPDRLFEYATTAPGRGIEVIIAGAGGAAHLPGMLAAKTLLPVIGVPIPTEHLGGLDSLLSIVQMPKGIPVATVAIGGVRDQPDPGGVALDRAQRGVELGEDARHGLRIILPGDLG